MLRTPSVSSGASIARAIACLSLAATVACGGGGGGIPSAEPGPTTTTPPPASPPPPATNIPDLGVGADLRGFRPFPPDDPWNTPIDAAPVDPNSATLIASIGLAKGLHPDFGADWDGGPFGIPYIVVPGTQPAVPMQFDIDDESDRGPYPFPADAPIEGGATSDGDRHVLAIDRDRLRLFETWSSYPFADPIRDGWACGSGAAFDLTRSPARTAGFTSADAAGLPIFPGLARYDEVVLRGGILHALRFTVSRTRRAYVAPATHFASGYTGADRPPMGMRVRLRSSFNTSTFPPQSRVILDCMKRYGMFVADNGGDWYVSGAPDARWDDEDLNALKGVMGSNFEVVRMGTIVTD